MTKQQKAGFEENTPSGGTVMVPMSEVVGERAENALLRDDFAKFAFLALMPKLGGSGNINYPALAEAAYKAADALMAQRDK